jgi:metallo-beta-lactamase family protein
MNVATERNMHIRFLGATNTVTGSKYLLESGKARVFIDCGLFQGYKQLRLRNWSGLPVDAASVRAVVLTHAHLDHSGYLPLLVKHGFKGRVYCTEATHDLCRIMLPDSGHLLEEEAGHANKHGYSKHAPAEPLYTQEDAERALKYFYPVKFGVSFDVAEGMRAEFHVAGHILGAAIVTVSCEGKTITFSGDLGRPDDPVMKPPAQIEGTDYLIVESTYGNRKHDPADPALQLRKVIRETSNRGGVVIIPSFTVGRAQTLLYYLGKLKDAGQIPALLPIYLNSPMAVDATTIYRAHSGDHRLSHEECLAMCHVAKIVNTVDESIALNTQHMPMVIIAGSGMATGGRVLHHLKAFAPDPRNTILFAGFQAGGTRGAAMVAGAEAIKIFGEYVPLRAQVAQIDNLSAHADGDEILSWLSHFKSPPKRTFVTHGEPDAADALRRRIEESLKWNCAVPDYGESFELV